MIKGDPSDLYVTRKVLQKVLQERGNVTRQSERKMSMHRGRYYLYVAREVHIEFFYWKSKTSYLRVFVYESY